MRLDEGGRLDALRDYQVLDSPAEPCFDHITSLAARLIDTPIALISLVDEHRQWFKSRVGLDASETPREYAFCDHAIRQEAPLVVDDALADPRFATNPLVTGPPGVRFYCGVPLRSPDGHGLGTLCLIDRVPRTIATGEVEALIALAREVEVQLELRRRLVALDAALRSQQDRQRQRELLASMVVHDLRNPLTAVSLLTRAIRPGDAASVESLGALGAAVERMGRMLNDLLDLCVAGTGGLRLRLGEPSLTRLAGAAVDRLAVLARNREQELALELPDGAVEVRADTGLLERVIENLVTNAIDHGPRGQRITVAVDASGERARCEVRDQAATIAPELHHRLFAAFESHGDGGHHGLGLAFARMAIAAHGGTLGLRPLSPRGNAFFFELSTST
jgi:signal transduction histidine kinase